MKLFHPSAPPEPYWRHFKNRDEAQEFCCDSWPPDVEALEKPLREVYFSMPLTLPRDPPHAHAGFWRVYDSVLNLCPPGMKNQPYKRPGSNKTKIRVYPVIVTSCAADAALAALQLYVATETGLLEAERRNKWEPFAAGYGCIGYYNVEAITYEPPPELDGRLR